MIELNPAKDQGLIKLPNMFTDQSLNLYQWFSFLMTAFSFLKNASFNEVLMTGR